MESKKADDTIALFTRISERFASIREELVAYRERRRARYVQFLRDQDFNLLLILVTCAWVAVLLGKYMPTWLIGTVLAVLLAGLIYVLVRRFLRKAC